jgi:large subunit ribosomal protein L30
MPASLPNLRIKLVRSPIGYTERQKATVRALGLRRLQQEVERPDNGPIRGMIFKIQHLVDVSVAEEKPAAPKRRRARASDESGETTAVPARRGRAKAADATEKESTDETA